VPFKYLLHHERISQQQSQVNDIFINEHIDPLFAEVACLEHYSLETLSESNHTSRGIIETFVAFSLSFTLISFPSFPSSSSPQFLSQVLSNQQAQSYRQSPDSGPVEWRGPTLPSPLPSQLLPTG